MFTDFDNMPDTSRLWIYMANRTLTNGEKQKAETYLREFTEQWQAHGKDLKSSFIIKYKQFIIILVDEAYENISGCSIDASVHLIKKLEKELDVELLSKLFVSFWEEDRIRTVGFKAFIDLCQKDIVHRDTIVFDNTIKTKGELEEMWQFYAVGCWTNKYIKLKNPSKVVFR